MYKCIYTYTRTLSLLILYKKSAVHYVALECVSTLFIDPKAAKVKRKRSAAKQNRYQSAHRKIGNAYIFISSEYLVRDHRMCLPDE
jgi:hypothetical protein